MYTIKKQGTIKKVSKEEFEKDYKKDDWEVVKKEKSETNTNFTLPDDVKEKLDLLESIDLNDLQRFIEILNNENLDKLESLFVDDKIDEQVKDLEKLKNDDLKKMLDEKSIEYDSNANKKELIDLLVNA